MLNSSQERLNYDSESETYWTTYDYPSVPPSVAIPLSLMELDGTDVTELEPLHTSVNPDALDAMFSPTTNHPRECFVEFTFEGHTIRVEPNKRIQIQASYRIDD